MLRRETPVQRRTVAVKWPKATKGLGLRTRINKSQPNSLITVTFRSHHETFIRRSWYSVPPDLDVTISCHIKKTVVGVTQLIAALITIHWSVAFLADMYSFLVRKSFYQPNESIPQKGWGLSTESPPTVILWSYHHCHQCKHRFTCRILRRTICCEYLPWHCRQHIIRSWPVLITALVCVESHSVHVLVD